MNRIVLASGNAHKLKEIREIFSDYEIVSCKDLGFNSEIEENGNSFYENALIKAKTVSTALNLPALADDSGICVNALGGAPGIYSARYAGDGNDESNNKKLLKELEGKKDRSAYYLACMVLYFPDGRIYTATGKTEGVIAEKEEGKGGFGYDPLFISKDLNKCFGLATEKEKNGVSHRFRALKSLREIIEKEGVIL